MQNVLAVVLLAGFGAWVSGHFDDPVALLGKARAALKPDGKLAIGEWFPSASAGTTGTYIYLFRPGEKR